MNGGWGVFSGFLLVIVIGGAVTSVVTLAIQRSSTPVSREGTRDGVLFVVNTRRWQRVLLRTSGIVLAVGGGFTLLMAATSPGEPESIGQGIAGAIIAVLGLCMVWGAHSRARVRLEVTAGGVWVFRTFGAPRLVDLGDVTRLTAIPSNNFGSYGGVVARSGRRKLFSATRPMLGYAELIAHVRNTRPDLRIPEASIPF